MNTYIKNNFLPGSSSSNVKWSFNPYEEDDEKNCVPQYVKPNYEILQLVNLYQQQLAELEEFHSLLVEDQNKLAAMISPYISKNKDISLPEDETILLLKQGIDLRLLQFEENCRTIQQTEKKLQNKLEESTLGYDSVLVKHNVEVDNRLIKQVIKQQRIINLQQRELDELSFQRDLCFNDAKKLRKICKSKNWILDENIEEDMQKSRFENFVEFPISLHQIYTTSKPCKKWMKRVIHSKTSAKHRIKTSKMIEEMEENKGGAEDVNNISENYELKEETANKKHTKAKNYEQAENVFSGLFSVFGSNKSNKIGYDEEQNRGKKKDKKGEKEITERLKKTHSDASVCSVGAGSTSINNVLMFPPIPTMSSFSSIKENTELNRKLSSKFFDYSYKPSLKDKTFDSNKTRGDNKIISENLKKQRTLLSPLMSRVTSLNID